MDQREPSFERSPWLSSLPERLIGFPCKLSRLRGARQVLHRYARIAPASPAVVQTLLRTSRTPGYSRIRTALQAAPLRHRWITYADSGGKVVKELPQPRVQSTARKVTRDEEKTQPTSADLAFRSRRLPLLGGG